MKRIQNRVAESRLTLLVTVLFGLAIWLLCGLIQQQWWIQFACAALSTYLMVELNNGNALIRIYSRTVSCAFIILSCIACFLFPSVEGAIAQLCLVASLLTLYHTYQDKASPGWTFYTFLLLGLASLVKVHVFFFVPVYWVIMAFFTYSLSWRTFLASIFGLTVPYWFLASIVLLRFQDAFTTFTNHFLPLSKFQIPFDYSLVSIPEILTYAFVIILAITGIIHYLRNSYNDKIRIRQIYYSLILLDVIALVFVCIQPQHYDLMMRCTVIATSPLIAHFLTLTHTRITNIAFCIIMGTAVLLTVLHLWISSFIF